MQPIVSDVVAWSVTVASPAKIAELIEMPFWVCTRVRPRNHTLDEDPGQFSGQKRARPGHDRWSIYSKRLSRGQHRYGADAD